MSSSRFSKESSQPYILINRMELKTSLVTLMRSSLIFIRSFCAALTRLAITVTSGTCKTITATPARVAHCTTKTRKIRVMMI